MSDSSFAIERYPKVVMDVVLSSALAVLALTLSFNASYLSMWPLVYFGLALFVWLGLWRFNHKVAGLRYRSAAAQRFQDIFVPAIFGMTLVWLWEVLCVGLKVPSVLLPAPSLIFTKLISSLPTLGADFVQTVLRAAIPGWIMGCLAGFGVALACDRYDFLRRGLMPIGNFISALPIIGIAPILVMWFGFDWQSKAAVVVVMTFFPMLVNTVTGLASAGQLERDLMRSYGATWGQTLLQLRLPAAMPFIFNALKINATLAMIGAIVAEFFGTPVVGMGFRISTEVGRMAVDMVWATIAVAAVAGSAFYGLLVLAERAVTFWHPSNRQR